MEEIEALVILNHIPYLGLKGRRKLLEHFGTAKEALTALSNWDKIDTWKRDLDLVAKTNTSLISYTDSRYPQSFLKLPDPPLILYVRGELFPSDQKALAIVGTRKCSEFGKQTTYSMAEEMSAAGYTIVSGLALGIDTAAHQGALNKGRTIAFIGSGLARVYPKENALLAEEIIQRGAVISELPMEAPAQNYQFLKRNRLIASSTIGILLTEAPIKSGAMMTVRLARKFKKSCFALAPLLQEDSFEGNRFLITSQKAHLVENARQMLSILELEDTVLLSKKDHNTHTTLAEMASGHSQESVNTRSLHG